MHSEINGRLGSVRTIEPELLLQEVRSGRTILIVDVRREAELRGTSGYIGASRSIPLHQLVARCAELKAYRHQRIVVVSAHGEHARMAALELEVAGFTEVEVLSGGIHRWIQLGFPVVRSSAAA